MTNTLNTWSPDLYSKAWDLATLAHEGQSYGGRIEGMQINYLNHIGSVAMEVVWGLQNSTTSYDANLAIQCAILRDVIVDTKINYQEILSMFGKYVADGVLALSKNTKIPSKEEQMKDSLTRIKQQPAEIRMVKMADRITNLYHPPFYWKNEKIISYRKEAMLIHEELKSANVIIADRLLNKINEYKFLIKS